MVTRLPAASRSARRVLYSSSKISVPGGTRMTRSSPERPDIFLPMPPSPRSARQWCRPAKSSSVFLFTSASKITEPPAPPSPPSGPPLGTYFSRRKETHPSPPSPAFTWIIASSTNMVLLILGASQRQCRTVARHNSRYSNRDGLYRAYPCRRNWPTYSDYVDNGD